MRKAFSMVQVVVILLVAVSLLSIATAYHNTRNAIVDTVERSEQLNELFRDYQIHGQGLSVPD